jgi:hypothetical protein
LSAPELRLPAGLPPDGFLDGRTPSSMPSNCSTSTCRWKADAVNLPSFLAVELLSDTTFGRGQGTAGEVDVEVEHDGEGLPLVRGKTLHGLLRDAWLSMSVHFSDLADAQRRAFSASRRISPTRPSSASAMACRADVRTGCVMPFTDRASRCDPIRYCRSLSDVRRQTARSRSPASRGKAAPAAWCCVV